MKFTFMISIVLLAGIFAYSAPITAWESRGPGGGGALYSPSINPKNPDEMYLTSDMGELFHSLTAGRNWQTINFRQLTGGHECAVRFTIDANICWALDYWSLNGGDSVRPKRTIDGGKSWQYLTTQSWPVERTAGVLYADYAHPERVLISADYRQLWITRDGGKTCQQVANFAGDTGLHFAGCFFDGETIYAGTNEAVLQSDDGGISFTRHGYEGIPAGEYPVSFAAGKSNGHTRLFCVTAKSMWSGISGSEHNAYQSVYCQLDGKGLWQRTIAGIASEAHPWFIKMAANNAEIAYLAGGSTQGTPTIYKTTNGGQQWKNVFDSTDNRNIIVGWAGDNDDFRWSFPEYALGFEVCLQDANRLFFSDLSCAHLSDDGGISWRQIYTGLTDPRLAGDTAPKGASYQSCGLEVTSIWQLAWFSQKTLFSAATDIKGFRSGDGGDSWSFNYSGHNLNTMYRVVKHPDTGICYAATSSIHDLYMSTYLQDERIDRGQGCLLFSADDGVNWKLMKNFLRPVIWVALDPTNPQRLYVAVVNHAEGGIYVTDELAKGEAASWRKLAAPARTEGHPYNLLVLNDGSLLCSYSGRRAGKDFTLSSGIFISNDGGASWQDRSDPGMRCWTKDLVLDPSDPAQNSWYVGVFHAWGTTGRAGKSGFYRTTDRGKSWKCLADNQLAPSGIMNVESCTFDPKNPQICYLSTEYDGLWYSEDIQAAAPIFQQITTYPFHHPLRIFFNPYDSGEMWVTSFGNGLYQTRIR